MNLYLDIKKVYLFVLNFINKPQFRNQQEETVSLNIVEYCLVIFSHKGKDILISRLRYARFRKKIIKISKNLVIMINYIIFDKKLENK